MADNKPTRLLPERQVAERYGVVPRTLFRWDLDPALGFPRPIYIRGRRFRVEAELDKFDLARSAASGAA
jgi:hypothetical protein